MLLNLVAIALSALALACSTYLAHRQVTLMHRSAYLPVYLAFLNEFRSMEFHDRYRFVCERLPHEHEPGNGLSGLPDEARRAVLDIAYYFQNLILVWRLSLLDEQVLATMGIRFLRVWDAIAPFVERERELMGAPEFRLMSSLEAFAEEVRQSRPPRRRRLL
ncbi:DUF4760 domain-containing protein [Actinomadura macra]|uniref:DUF4760 domain-containing protein n=1 Tax=Actinomadura macra TaxID=46164 RepID=UPI000AFEDD0A|nr:hypothetical protein [Actinomadura macra]